MSGDGPNAEALAFQFKQPNEVQSHLLKADERLSTLTDKWTQIARAHPGKEPDLGMMQVVFMNGLLDYMEIQAEIRLAMSAASKVRSGGRGRS